MNRLNKNDYKKILEYYNLTIPKSYRLLKSKATSIISDKLCKCIKKVNKTYKKNKNENLAISICTKSVINKKGLKRSSFTCKKKLNKKNITLKK